MKKKTAAKDVRFVTDGTVTDNLLKVMWGPTLPKGMTYSKAEKACKELSFAGYKDWRLPTINELFSLVDQKKYNPAINKDFFPDTKNSWYWTSEECVGRSSAGWVVYFGDGSIDGYCRYNNGYVRPVRQVRGTK